MSCVFETMCELLIVMIVVPVMMVRRRRRWMKMMITLLKIEMILLIAISGVELLCFREYRLW